MSFKTRALHYGCICLFITGGEKYPKNTDSVDPNPTAHTHICLLKDEITVKREAYPKA